MSIVGKTVFVKHRSEMDEKSGLVKIVRTDRRTVTKVVVHYHHKVTHPTLGDLDVVKVDSGDTWPVTKNKYSQFESVGAF